MKNHAKVGGRKGKPTYRTPSHFRFNVKNRVVKAKFSGKKECGKVQ